MRFWRRERELVDFAKIQCHSTCKLARFPRLLEEIAVRARDASWGIRSDRCRTKPRQNVLPLGHSFLDFMRIRATVVASSPQLYDQLGGDTDGGGSHRVINLLVPSRKVTDR